MDRFAGMFLGTLLFCFFLLAAEKRIFPDRPPTEHLKLVDRVCRENSELRGELFRERCGRMEAEARLLASESAAGHVDHPAAGTVVTAPGEMIPPQNVPTLPRDE